MNNKNLNISLDGSIIKWLFFLSLPILIWNLLQSSYNFIDAYWIWKISKEAVASISISFPILFFIEALWTGFSMAWTILIAQYAWAKNKKMINKTTSYTLTISIFLAIILWIIWYFSSEYILNIMKIDKNVIDYSVSYLKIIFIWLVSSFIFSMFQSIMRWIWEVKLPMYIIWWTVLLNFIIDPIFILWFWPIPAMWVSGAALATIIAETLSAIIWIYILFKGIKWVKIDLKDLIPNSSFFKKIFFIWLPSSIEMSIRSFWRILLAWLISYFWTTSLAWFWAWWNIFQFVFIPAIGFSIALSTMVWQNIWARNLARAQEITKIWIYITFIILEIIWLLVFIFSPFLISIFINDADSIKIWVNFLRIAAFSFGIMWIQFALTWVFRAAWNTTLVMILSIFSIIIIQIPIAFLLSIYLKLWINWVWWSFVITNIIMTTIYLLLYIKWDWKNKKITDEEEEKEKEE